MSKPREEKMIWSDSYSMGIKVVDEQHKGLMEFVNDISNQTILNEKEELFWFQDIIEQMVKYTKIHFQTEESLMNATSFPGYMSHKKIHNSFILAVIKAAREFDEGKRLVRVKFAIFLKDWIQSHIAIMDKQYSDYFWKIATRKADGKLSITRADIDIIKAEALN